MKSIRPYMLWISKITLSILFLLASLGKLTQNGAVIDMFTSWGYFDGFYLIIGVLELSFAILLLIPKTSMYSAIALFVIMIGALITHLIHDPIDQIFRPLIFMALLSGVILLQRRKE